jgi:hypothetical protein
MGARLEGTLLAGGRRTQRIEYSRRIECKKIDFEKLAGAAIAFWQFEEPPIVALTDCEIADHPGGSMGALTL